MSSSLPKQTVSERYDALVRAGTVDRDSAQITVARDLDEVLEAIRGKRLANKHSALGWLFGSRRKPDPIIRGLYIHGPVGRGKTMLMDIFHALVPAERKRRAHFHAFMEDVHKRIHAHRQAFKRGETNEEDPIPPVAAVLAREAWALCFDEFSVTDIADAMILSRLFTALFGQGCVLVTTSNVPPQELYQDGLNRELFLPFLDVLHRHVKTVSLEARTDYRLEKTRRLPVYISPLGPKTRAEMDEGWASVTSGKAVHSDIIARKGRKIEVHQATGDAARFSFAELCERPLGAADYLAIAGRYHTVFVDDVPRLDEYKRNEAKRFINLVDTFYDNHVRLVLSADAEPRELYHGRKGNEAFEFDRTASRLYEMQTEDYLKKTIAARQLRSTEAAE